jgi:hypothetical protein
MNSTRVIRRDINWVDLIDLIDLVDLVLQTQSDENTQEPETCETDSLAIENFPKAIEIKTRHKDGISKITIHLTSFAKNGNQIKSNHYCKSSDIL